MPRPPVSLIDVYIDELKKPNATLTSIELMNDTFTAEQFRELMGLLKGKNCLKEMTVLGCWLEDDLVRVMCDALIPNTSLETLDLSENVIGDAGAKELEWLMRASSNLHGLTLDNNNIEDGGVAAIIRGMEGHPTLSVVNLSNNSFSDFSLQSFAEAGVRLPQMTGLFASGPWKEPERFTKTLTKHPSRNFVQFRPSNKGLDAMCETNRRKVQDILDVMDDPAALKMPSVVTLFEAQERRHAIDSVDRLGGPEIPFRTKFAALLDTLPALDATAPLTPETLLKADANGFTPLDSPRNWLERPELLQATIDLLTGDPSFETLRTPKGHTLLEYGLLACETPAQFVAALNEKGIQLQRDFITTPDGTLSPLATRMAERGELQSLFTRQNWDGADLRDLKAALAVIPEEIRASQIGNAHALASALLPRIGVQAR